MGFTEEKELRADIFEVWEIIKRSYIGWTIKSVEYDWDAQEVVVTMYRTQH